ncbi:MAG: hypothetical protein D3924_10465 [Candidatus Electrothrix sp. AR4]|nr:hypothetical protein [Candidatus Electrothrix sp. AR4]
MLKKKILTGVILPLFVGLCIFVGFSSAAQEKVQWLDNTVSIRFQNKSLEKVLKGISLQTGVVIIFDQEMADQKVSGNYKKIKLSDAINRLFLGKDKTVQIGRAEKIIVVKTFGTKKFMTTGGSAPNKKDVEARLEDNSEMLLFDGMTSSELRKRLKKQNQEFEARREDDNEIIAGDMTRGQLRADLKKQNEEFEARLKDDNEIIAGKMTRGQLRADLKKQNEEFEARRKDDNEIIAGDMTRAQLRAHLKKQATNLSRDRK